MKREKGFSLIELTVVMAIIAVLSVMIIVAIRAATNARKESQNRSNARTIEVALEAHASRNQGSYCYAGAVPAGRVGIVCGATDELDQAGAKLAATVPAYLTGNIQSPCANGGGVFTAMTADSFTIQVANNACAVGAAAIDTITH